MTVMCELHNIMKELKAATERANQGEPYASIQRSDPTPLEDNMFTSSLDEPLTAQGATRATPKKAGGRGTLRGVSSSNMTSSAGGSSSTKTKPSPHKSKGAGSDDKVTNRGGLGTGRTTEGSKDGNDAEKHSLSSSSPPPPPPSDSPMHSSSPIPPPPIASDGGAFSGGSSPIPPPPLESSESPPPPPPPDFEASPTPPISANTSSAEHTDVATYVSTHMERDSASARPKDSAKTQTSANAPQKTAAAPNTASNARPTAQTSANTAKPAAASTAKNTAAAANAPKLIQHEMPHSFVKITKDSIEEVAPLEHSALSKLLGPSDVHVWLPGAKNTFAVRILPSANMADLVRLAVKARNSSLAKGEKSLETSPDAYNVRVATPDGKVDDLFPILGKKGTLDQWAEVAFILVENPNYKPGGSGQPREKSHDSSVEGGNSAISAAGGNGVGGAGGSGAVGGQTSSGGVGAKGANSIKGVGNTSSSASGAARNATNAGNGSAGTSTASSAAATSSSTASMADKLTIRVTLPTGAYHTVLAEPSMKMSKLLTLICDKRKMIASHYALTTLSKEYLSHTTRVQDLQELHLVLEAKAVENPLGPPSVEEIFYNDNVAVQYKLFQNITFHVRNKKKFNVSANAKTEPVSLGIDGTTFTIIFPKRAEKNSSTFAYAISDLKSASLTEDNPFVVNIDTIKEKDKLVFEASSAAQALEITTKVSVLIDLSAKDAKD